ncbi:MAG: iron-containing alcohol dehydrogenase [Candidatus Hodarchaeota archaeon]
MQFEFLSTPKIFFGQDKFQNIGILAKEFGSNLFIVTSESALPKSTFAQSILENQVAKFKFNIETYIIKGEPTIETVDIGTNKANEFRAEVVVGLGGGSVLDASKAIAGLITNGGSARDYLEVFGKGKTIAKPPLPIIAIPTTAGTGSEATKNAVILAKEEQFKTSIRSSLLIPKIAIIDPTLMVTVPPSVTATCGMDAFTQLIEAYTSKNAQPMTDALAVLGIKKVAISLLSSYKNGQLLEARANMALASLISGICLVNAGLGAVHGFASPLGGLNIPHGIICAALLASTIETNISTLKTASKKNMTLEKYTHIAEIITDRTFSKMEFAHESLINFLRSLTEELKIPKLSEFGVTESIMPMIVEKAKRASSMKYNPIHLDNTALTNILKQAT